MLFKAKEFSNILENNGLYITEEKENVRDGNYPGNEGCERYDGHACGKNTKGFSVCIQQWDKWKGDGTHGVNNFLEISISFKRKFDVSRDNGPTAEELDEIIKKITTALEST